jgi:hypothetical protein
VEAALQAQKQRQIEEELEKNRLEELARIEEELERLRVEEEE